MSYTTPTRPALYARVSLDHEQTRLAVDRQVDICRKWCVDRGWGEPRLYVDNSVSASSGVSRPQYAALLRDIRGGEVDGVIAYGLDRIVRRVRDVVSFLDVVQTAKIPATTVLADLDLTSPQGVLTAQMLASIAEHEVALKAERQKRANDQRRAAGRHYGRAVAFGYRRVGETLEPDENADEVRQAYGAVLEGASVRDILVSWNARGLTTRHGKPWARSSVRHVLHNPVYTGKVLHKGEIVGEGNWEPLVSEETFALAQAALSTRSREATPAPQPHTYLLSGLLVCSCGRYMTGNRRSSREGYLCVGRESNECSRGIGIEEEEKVTRHVLYTLQSLRPHQILAPEVIERQAEIASKLAKLAKEREEIEGDDEISLRSMRTLLARVDDKHSKLLGELDGLVSDSLLARLLAHVLPWEIQQGTVAMGSVSRSIEAIRAAYTKLGRDQQRTLIAALGVYHVRSKGKGYRPSLDIYARDPQTGEVSTHSIDEDPYA